MSEVDIEQESRRAGERETRRFFSRSTPRLLARSVLGWLQYLQRHTSNKILHLFAIGGHMRGGEVGVEGIQ